VHWRYREFGGPLGSRSLGPGGAQAIILLHHQHDQLQTLLLFDIAIIAVSVLLWALADSESFRVNQ